MQFVPRAWQKEALEVYAKRYSAGRQSILWEATPGAGKTRVALRLASYHLSRTSCTRVIVVVPTSHLKIQWARSALGFSMHLDHEYRTEQGQLASDYHGLVLTYQQICMSPKRFSALARGAVVILDEVHHAGDGLTWGDALREAVGDADFILCLSGTAFRSDNSKIPFVHYDSGGASEPDYVYGYSDAIRDSVCRPAVFFTYGGLVSWSSGESSYQADFSDALDATLRTRRLRAALDPASGWMEPLLQDAHEMLIAARKTHPEAGALLVAANQRHARALARLIAAISRERPTVVLSDDASASAKLKAFAESNQSWIVACNMVSEGVDIPRLRVGVYATTIRTKMYFRQFLGRIVRRTNTPSGVQPAFCYLPADPWLQRLAEEIEHEQRHYTKLPNEQDFFLSDFERQDERKEPSEQTWQALQSTNSGVSSIISQGGQLSLWGGASGSSFSVEAPPLPGAGEAFISRSDLKAEIAREIRTLVSHYHHRTGESHARIHGLLNKKQAVRNQRECSENQLRERIKFLEELMQGA